jgi:hypothetical protein
MFLRKCLIAASLATLATTSFALTTINLDSPIVPPMTTNVIAKLKSTPKSEPIFININSPGGLVSEMHSIIDELQRHADVTCKVDEYAASAAANILMACKHKQISDGAIILFHIYQTCNDKHTKCSPIKTKDFGADVVAGLKYRTALREFKLFQDVFTPKEWEAISSGQDVIIMGWDLKQRLKTLNML